MQLQLSQLYSELVPSKSVGLKTSRSGCSICLTQGFLLLGRSKDSCIFNHHNIWRTLIIMLLLVGVCDYRIVTSDISSIWEALSMNRVTAKNTFMGTCLTVNILTKRFMKIFFSAAFFVQEQNLEEWNLNWIS